MVPKVFSLLISKYFLQNLVLKHQSKFFFQDCKEHFVSMQNTR